LWVGTERDQSTARLGESLYRFVGRTIPGCFLASWELEKKHLARIGSHTLSKSNRMLVYLVRQMAYSALLVGLFSPMSLIFFVGQALVAIFMLETVSYIEHYGLHREKSSRHQYAALAPHHSWDCYLRYSNYLTFDLQRHASHHSNPLKRHELVHAMPGALRLPAGYPVMISLSMIPPLWRRVMDRRVPAPRDGLQSARRC
jgi:alkane 1-monooxygenase